MNNNDQLNPNGIRDVSPRGPGIDAIVVPAARPAGDLKEVIDLAGTTRTMLVVLCSKQALPGEVAAALRRDGRAPWMVIAPPPQGWTHPLLSVSTDRSAEARWGWGGCDVSSKRNAGLLLASLAGWRRLVFVDDDVRDLDAPKLNRAGALMRRYPAARFRVRKFHKSVVRHADRLAGASQDVALISGGALAVDVRAVSAFFPQIYNDDTFFMLPTLLARGLIVTAGVVSQQPYDPFDDGRAAREEFGDLLADGMLDRLVTRGVLDAPSELDWARTISERDRFLLGIVTRLSAQAPVTDAIRAKRAVQAARDRLRAIPPSACRRFIEEWQSSLQTWRQRVAGLPTSLSPLQAASLLGLPLHSASLAPRGD